MAGILDGKVALVTGGGSGIGRATAVAMAREGARVAVSDLSKEGIEATVALINAGGGQGIAIAGDVADEAAVANMVGRTVSAFGRIDCAFNNAGVAGRSVGPVGQRTHELSQSSVGKMFSINLMGVFLCMKHEITQMLVQGGGGAIVNTASIAGLIGLATSAHYVCGQARCGRPDQERGGGVCPRRHQGELRQSRLHQDADDQGDDGRALR
jgi:NAD(P)-dependent dehydrogenase (short-subunit alcohol dehydrogenase family)